MGTIFFSKFLIIFFLLFKFCNAQDLWVATSTNNAPVPRGNHTAIWTGSKMIVWVVSMEIITIAAEFTTPQQTHGLQQVHQMHHPQDMNTLQFGQGLR